MKHLIEVSLFFVVFFPLRVQCITLLNASLISSYDKV